MGTLYVLTDGVLILAQKGVHVSGTSSLMRQHLMNESKILSH